MGQIWEVREGRNQIIGHKISVYKHVQLLMKLESIKIYNIHLHAWAQDFETPGIFQILNANEWEFVKISENLEKLWLFAFVNLWSKLCFPHPEFNFILNSQPTFQLLLLICCC